MFLSMETFGRVMGLLFGSVRAIKGNGFQLHLICVHCLGLTFSFKGLKVMLVLFSGFEIWTNHFFFALCEKRAIFDKFKILLLWGINRIQFLFFR